jgi:hypothetical protein
MHARLRAAEPYRREDKTPNAIILNRILLNSLHIAGHDDLVQQDGSDLIDMIVLLSRKLLSVWTHLQAYEAHEKALATQAAEWPITKREHSQELYEEFDVFSVQIKSTLDHLVQIMGPILGRNKWTMYSFGDGSQLEADYPAGGRQNRQDAHPVQDHLARRTCIASRRIRGWVKPLANG